MEEMASLWCYQELNPPSFSCFSNFYTVDEMRQKLLYVNLELEQLKAEKDDEMRKHKEYVKQLIQLLNIVCQERDEAKDQLQKLLNKLDSDPFVKSTKANSSITESNSLSETYNYHNSHNSSPKIDSFFDAVSSPEFSNNMADSNAEAYYMNQPMSHDRNIKCLRAQLDSKVSLVIDNLVKGKTLPQQGKLLQAVLEAGPLLQTLLVSGQLPQWRNPPQLKPSNIPPVSIKGCESDITNQNLDASYLSHSASRSLQISCNFDMSCGGSSQMLSTSMLNFTTFASGSCLENQSLMSSGADLNSFVLGKRQRLH